MMHTKIYVIKLTEDIEGNGTSVTNKFVVLNSKERAVEAQKMAFYNCLDFWMREWGYKGERPLEEVFEIIEKEDCLVALAHDCDEIYCDIEVVNEF